MVFVLNAVQILKGDKLGRSDIKFYLKLSFDFVNFIFIKLSKKTT